MSNIYSNTKLVATSNYLINRAKPFYTYSNGKPTDCHYNVALAINILLKHSQKRAAEYFLTWLDPKRRFKAEMKVATIAREISLTVRPTQTVLRGLQKKGFLKIDYRGDMHMTNRYELDAKALIKAAFQITPKAKKPKEKAFQKTAPFAPKKQHPTYEYYTAKYNNMIVIPPSIPPKKPKRLRERKDTVSDFLSREVGRLAKSFDQVHGTKTGPSDLERFIGTLRRRGLAKTTEQARKSISQMFEALRIIQASPVLKTPREGVCHTIGRLFSAEAIVNADKAHKHVVTRTVGTYNGHRRVEELASIAQTYGMSPRDFCLWWQDQNVEAVDYLLQPQEQTIGIFV